MIHNEDKGLVRAIRRWDLVAITINAIIGAGIFGLPSKVFGQIGSYSLFAFIACALVVALIVLCFAEVGSRFDATGGPYLYAREAFGSLVGFEVGWLIWLARLTGFAANLNLFVDYLAFFLPSANVGSWRNLIIVTVVLLLAFVNIIGVRSTTRVSNIFTIGKLLPIFLFIIVGFFFLAPENFSFTADLQYKTFSTSVLTMIYAFTGFEMATAPAGEIRNPQKNLPIALLTAIAIVALLYISIQIVSIGTLPELADSVRPVADAGSRFLGRAGGAIITAGVLISIIGNLNMNLLAGSRTLFAIGERGELPRPIAATHERFRTPHVAIMITIVIIMLLALSSSFYKQVQLNVIAKLVSYAATALALIVLRNRKDAPPAVFKAPAGIAAAIITLLAIIWLLSNASLLDVRDSAIAAVVGLALYLGYQFLSRSRKVATIAEE